MSISFVCRARSVRDGFYSHHTARVKAEENEREGEREREENFRILLFFVLESSEAERERRGIFKGIGERFWNFAKVGLKRASSSFRKTRRRTPNERTSACVCVFLFLKRQKRRKELRPPALE